MLQHVGDLSELRDRLREVFHILNKRLNVAHRDSTLHGKNRARNSHSHISQIAHEAHDGHHETRKKLRAPRRLIERLIRFAESGNRRVFLVERAHDGLARERFLNLAIDFTEFLLLSAEVPLAALHNDFHQNERQWNHKQRDKRHLNIDGQHHNKHANHGSGARDELRHALVQALPQRIDIVGDARKHVAGARALKIAHGKAIDFLGDLAAQAIARALRDRGHHPALYERARGAHAIQRQRGEQNGANCVEIDATGAADFGDDAVEQLGGRLRKHLRAHDIEGGRRHGEHDGRNESYFELPHEAHEFANGALEVLCLFSGHHATHGATSAAAARRCRLQLCHFLLLAHCASPSSSSSSDSCESAISRYGSQASMSSACVPQPTTRPSSSTTIWSA